MRSSAKNSGKTQINPELKEIIQASERANRYIQSKMLEDTTQQPSRVKRLHADLKTVQTTYQHKIDEELEKTAETSSAMLEQLDSQVEAFERREREFKQPIKQVDKSDSGCCACFFSLIRRKKTETEKPLLNPVSTHSHR